MAGLISQLAPHQGKTSQELVTQKQTKFALEATNLKQPASIAYSIAHAIPGRIRLRVPRIAQDPDYLERLEALLKADTWVTSERSNSAAASIVVTYESSKIKDDKMRSHLVKLIQSASNAVATQPSTQSCHPPQPVKQLTPRACSLEVRQVKVAPERCGLLKSSLGEPLKGGALKARMNKLHRIGILI
jgi:hypothetical protein